MSTEYSSFEGGRRDAALVDRMRLTPPGFVRLSPPAVPAIPALSVTLTWALDMAARRAAAVIAPTSGKSAEEIHEVLQAVVAALPMLARRLDATAPLSAEVEIGLDPGPVVPRRFIEVLRSELMAELSVRLSQVDGREALTVLAALEDLARRGDQTATGKFVARLAGAESVNAVVEIAHDIRSPLSSILFLVDTIRRGQSGGVSPVQERQLGLIYGAALGLSTLSSDLIDAVRGARLVDGHPVPFSITDVVQSVCAIVHPIGEEKSLPVHVSRTGADGRIGYPSAINRVLLNLTSNALRYTDSGSVSIGCRDSGEGRVEFSVSDTGRGIPDSVLAMLFDGFRPGSTGIRFSSAGLGLAICRTLLEAMGSSLEVETGAEEGTRFSFTLDLPPA